ncbi:MAG: hypothetical protein PHR24_03270, partial [Oscillospiraceae bacterium]|nr:hypothetical protein [Oscillospiraceae bacterium]
RARRIYRSTPSQILRLEGEGFKPIVETIKAIAFWIIIGIIELWSPLKTRFERIPSRIFVGQGKPTKQSFPPYEEV